MGPFHVSRLHVSLCEAIPDISRLFIDLRVQLKYLYGGGQIILFKDFIAEIVQRIFDNIEAMDNFLFVISPDSVASTYGRKEIDHAALNNKRMVPIFYEPVPDDDIPAAVAKYQRIDLTGSDDFDAKFAKVIATLDTDLDWKQVHTRLLTRVTEWEREGKGQQLPSRHGSARVTCVSTFWVIDVSGRSEGSVIMSRSIFLQQVSFIAQRHHRVHARCSPCGYEAGEQGHSAE